MSLSSTISITVLGTAISHFLCRTSLRVFGRYFQLYFEYPWERVYCLIVTSVAVVAITILKGYSTGVSDWILLLLVSYGLFLIVDRIDKYLEAATDNARLDVYIKNKTGQ